MPLFKRNSKKKSRRFRTKKVQQRFAIEALEPRLLLTGAIWDDGTNQIENTGEIVQEYQILSPLGVNSSAGQNSLGEAAAAEQGIADRTYYVYLNSGTAIQLPGVANVNTLHYSIEGGGDGTQIGPEVNGVSTITKNPGRCQNIHLIHAAKSSIRCPWYRQAFYGTVLEK